MNKCKKQPILVDGPVSFVHISRNGFYFLYGTHAPAAERILFSLGFSGMRMRLWHHLLVRFTKKPLSTGHKIRPENDPLRALGLFRRVSNVGFSPANRHVGFLLPFLLADIYGGSTPLS